MSKPSNSTEGQPRADRVGLIGDVLELAAHALGAIVRVFVRS